MLILASNSPRRKLLLDLTGWEYRLLAAPVDESARPGEPPARYVQRLAEEKARAVLPLIPAAERAQAAILAADTTVALEDEILGKPADAAEAEAMLRRLRDRSHQVYTALYVLRPDDGSISETACTTVRMRAYTDGEIEAYVLSGDPLDKAGAYAIQHAGFHPVQNLQGCYANVMGLPVCQLAGLLRKLGMQPANSIVEACQAALNQPCEVYLQVTDAS
jgi:nucleoside triphosphate pyrophosphatase